MEKVLGYVPAQQILSLSSHVNVPNNDQLKLLAPALGAVSLSYFLIKKLCTAFYNIRTVKKDYVGISSFHEDTNGAYIEGEATENPKIQVSLIVFRLIRLLATFALLLIQGSVLLEHINSTAQQLRTAFYVSATLDVGCKLSDFSAYICIGLCIWAVLSIYHINNPVEWHSRAAADSPSTLR